MPSLPSADASREVAMSRIQLAVASIFLVALAPLGASDRAVAQAGCQPTITQPCTNAPARANSPTPNQKRSLQADDDNAPKDHSPHIKLNDDTEFKFGTQGIGLGRKF
jgi:hypothetical protein